MVKVRHKETGTGRPSKFVVACINLVLQPHSERKYVELFDTIYKKKLDAKVRGDDALMIGSFHKSVTSQENGIAYTGDLFKFLKLNAAEDWFNTLKMDSASRSDVKGIVIPEHLKPHFKRFPYVFFPKAHRLYFISKKAKHNLSPNLVKRFFDAISEHPDLAKFGDLNATVQPEKGITDEFFKIGRITLIELDIRRPNPDDHEDLEDEILDRLDELNARRELIQYNEASPNGLKPDSRLRALATVAAENGSVYVKGKSQGTIVELSSKERPLTSQAEYYSSTQTELDALLQRAQQLHLDIIRRNGRN